MKRLSVAILSVIAASAMADTNSNSGFYLGLGVSNAKSSSDTQDSMKFTPAEIFGGYKLNPYVGGEVRVGTSLGGDNKITDFESIYYRVESANTVGKTYLLAGVSHVNMDTKNLYELDMVGFSYGAGVGFIINNRFNLNLEYKVLATGTAEQSPSNAEEDMQLNSLSATVDFRF